MQSAIINVNGEILTPDEARVSVYDRGYLYGDSLYEVIRTLEGRPIAMTEHLARLEASAALCRMVLGQKVEQYRSEMERTLAVFQRAHGAKSEAYIRLIVTRGVGKIGFGLGCLQTPTQFTILVQPLEPPTRAQYEKGLNLKIVDRLRNHPRALDPAMKSGNYLNSLLAYLEAVAESPEYDDALLCNGDGHLTEGTTFNFFYVRRGILATPPLDIGILDGITRRQTLHVAAQLGIEAREVRFGRDRLFGADEVFITSTIKGVFPVSQIDGKPVRAKAGPGPLTRRLGEALNSHLIRSFA